MTGRISNTALNDIIKIIGSREAVDIGFKIQVKIIIDDDNIVLPLTVDAIYIVRDFVNENFDKMQLSVTVPAGDFTTKIFPNRDIVQAEVTFSYHVLTGEGEALELPGFRPFSRRYKANMPDVRDLKASAETHTVTNGDLGNIDGMKELTLLLTDIDKDTVLHTTIGTTVRRTTTANAIKGLLTYLFNQLPLSTEKGATGVDIAPGASEDIHEQIVIPQMKEILAIPKYLQEHEHGVFPGGCGVYMQDNVCYVYPPYDTAQVTKGARTVTIINLQPDVYPAAETTWYEVDGEIYILATSETKVVDPTEAIQASVGAGVQYANADSLFRIGATVKDGALYINDKSNTVKTSILARRDEFNFLIPGTKPITANHLHENSELAKNNGALARIAWENSKVGLIKPGMAVRFLTIDGQGVKEYHGVVQGVLHNIVKKTRNIADPFFVSNSVIDVFMTYDPIDEYDLTGES